MPDILSSSLSYAHIPLLSVVSPGPEENEKVKGAERVANITAVTSTQTQRVTHSDPAVSHAQDRALSWRRWLTKSQAEKDMRNDAELQKVHYQGVQLQRMVEECFRTREELQTIPAAACKFSGKMWWLAGVALVAVGTGAFAWGRNPFQAHGTYGPVAELHNKSNNANARADGDYLFALQPAAAAIFAHRETATEKFQPDDVKVVKLDFSCLEQRQSLTLSAVLRQIGSTLSNPITELAKESQVIDYYNKLGRCPDDKEMAKLTDVTLKVDKTVNALLSLIPGMMPVVAMQRIGADLFRMLADDLEGKASNQQDVRELNEQLLMLAKTIVDVSPRDENGQVDKDKLAVPDNTFLKNGQLQTDIRGNKYAISHQQGQFIASGNNKNFAVTYSNREKKWIPVEENNLLLSRFSPAEPGISEEKFSHYEIIDFEIASALKDVPKLDAKLFTYLHPNKNGVYRVHPPENRQKLYAVKLNGQFYAVRNGEKKRQLTVEDSNDIAIVSHDGKYYLDNNAKTAEVKYIPCRIKRSPSSSCMAFSADVEKILADNHDIGLDPARIGRLEPDKDNPAIMVSVKGKKYIKYNDVLFKVKTVSMISAGHDKGKEVHIFGKKPMGLLKTKRDFHIGNGYFSRVHGEGFLNSEIESTMEACAYNRPSAEAYQLLRDFERGEGVITAEEYKAINIYGESGYMFTNDFMLRGMPEDYVNPAVREKAFSMVKNIRVLLQKLPSYKGVVYRGSKLDSEDLSKLSEIKPGGIISSKRFISSSTDPAVARSFSTAPADIFYEIHVQKAAHPVMLYTGKIHEAEVLIEDHTVFKCKAVDGKNVVLEEVVNPSSDDMGRLIYVFI